MSRIDVLLRDIVDKAKSDSKRQNWCTYVSLTKCTNLRKDQARTIAAALACDAVMATHPGIYGYDACRLCIGNAPRLNQWLKELEETLN